MRPRGQFDSGRANIGAVLASETTNLGGANRVAIASLESRLTGGFYRLKELHPRRQRIRAD